MSDETWIAEFYPKKAKETSPEEAVAHSLQKWIGLRQVNMEKHDCDWTPIGVDARSCALCHHYFEDEDDDGRYCAKCPLAALLGRPCDADGGAPWYAWHTRDDPEPMIAALKTIK